MQVIEPTDKDKGIYSIVITDLENSHKRSLDLSGEGQSVSSPQFHSALIDQLKTNQRKLDLPARAKGSSSAAWKWDLFAGKIFRKNNKINVVSIESTGSISFLVAGKCVNISQRKAQSSRILVFYFFPAATFPS